MTSFYFRLILPLTFLLVVMGCGSARKLTPKYDEIRMLDTMVVTAPAYEEQPVSMPDELPEYQASATRAFDLLHTRLELSFDWETESVKGIATLSLKPYFFPANELELDAKDFQLQEIRLAGVNQDLPYVYDGEKLKIRFGKTYQRTDTIQVRIRYTAHPSATGGGWAITSDQGLFFINPRGEEAGKPRQIWTQGETESNSRWFPTIDKPNERCTQELILTVEDQFKTLSNGILVSSVKNPDGSRTDYWKMDQPHAPYLFMLAVGDYAVVEDRWRDVPLQYYVEPEFEADAKAIFPYTPEMLEFFSKLLDYPYPWPKFAQVVVRDYVSGAMENTTAVVFGEFVNGKTRELVDVLDNETIVAHEMFHQWFGDLVTCESWANLTMNEGFANYSEYLWLEQKHGRDEAEYHMILETDDYVFSSQSEAHPLIHYRYSDRDAMFDQHSYNKGGLTLHMLRKYLGDDAFFTGLNHYLVKNAFTDVEADELRLAMEDVSGQDLNWFFDQWFFQKGHPVLDIRYNYDEEAGEAAVRIEQTQSSVGMPPVFQFPLEVQLFLPDGTNRVEKTWIKERVKELRYPAPAKPLLVLTDPERILLCERVENKQPGDYFQQARIAPNVRDRLEALQKLADGGHPKLEQLLAASLDDPFWAIRLFALENLEIQNALLSKISEMATGDRHSKVRAMACYLLGQAADPHYIPELEKVIDTDFAVYTVASALDALRSLAPEKALAKAESLEPTAEGFLQDVIAEIYLNEQDTSKLDFFLTRMNSTGEYTSLYYLMGYLQLSRLADLNQLSKAAGVFFDIASGREASIMKRFAAMRGLNEIHVELVNRAASNKQAKENILLADKAVLQKIESVKANEQDKELRDIYQNFPDPK